MDYLLAGQQGCINSLLQEPERNYLIKEKRPLSNIKQVQSFNLYSTLLAVGVTYVDYFSLDTEGSEVSILLTIPWDEVKIRIFQIEYIAMKNRLRELRDFFKQLGLYKEVAIRDKR